MQLPPIQVDIIRRPIRIAPGELWCRDCGESVNVIEKQRERLYFCPLCHSPALVPAVSVLQPDEFYIAH